MRAGTSRTCACAWACAGLHCGVWMLTRCLLVLPVRHIMPTLVTPTCILQSHVSFGLQLVCTWLCTDTFFGDTRRCLGVLLGGVAGR